MSKAKINVKDLSPGERLILLRRRTGATQAEEAEEHGVSLLRYRRWEKDEIEGAPKVPLGKLKPGEIAFVLRRRKGLSLRAAADEMGVCPWWLRQMETGQVNQKRLLDFWNL